MKIHRSFSGLPDHQVTDEKIFRLRRNLVLAMGLSPLMPGLSSAATRCDESLDLGRIETPTRRYLVSHYNNYFEFSTNKEAVALLADKMSVRPWTLEIKGEVERPVRWDLEDLVSHPSRVERSYRFRCVEGWSMVVPWQGIPLCALLSAAKPTSRARFVRFRSHVDPEAMVGMQRTGLEFPYTEGLRIDEAMHPLTLLATGLYGEPLPASNGAPLRLVVPWKYGYKSAKAIVSIELIERQPETSWHRVSPDEYGFYANVDPEQPHPRWSQRRELRLGETRKRRTLPFNGYADWVADLYRGQDLARLS